MPVIEFACPRCNTKFEELIFKQSEIEKVCCPKCKCRKPRRLFSVFGVIGKTVAGHGSASSCTSCARSSCAGCGR